MWMMGYNDGGDFNMIQDSAFTGRKLRPLIPRPLQSPPTTTTPACCSRIHASSDFFAQYHHLGEQRGLKEFNSVPQVLVSSRWNPTPEQLRALEELYRRGTRTPSAEQIQQITAQLRKYGKIEGKNVFYWFQNHKARERQKRRRQMESSHDDLQLMSSSSDHQNKESPGGTNRTMYEAEETKNWAPSTNCMTATSVQNHQQESVKAAGPGSRADGWVQFSEEELLLQQFQQQQRGNSLSTSVEKNGTWQMMMPPPWTSCPPPPPSMSPSPSPPSTLHHDLTHHLINTPTCTSRATVRTMDIMDPKQQLINNSNPNNNKTSLLQPHDLSIFIAPYGSNAAALNHLHHLDEEEEEEEDGDSQEHESQTLQLFPLRSSSWGEKEEKSGPNTNYQFFEFLPLKN